MKKIIAVISIIAIICCLCSAVNAAEEGADVDISTSVAVTSVETVAGSVESAPETAPSTPDTADVGAPDDETESTAQSLVTYMGEFVKWAWRTLLKWWDKIVATLAAMILAIIHRAQKKEIVPNLEIASSGVSNSITTYDIHKKAWEKKIEEIINQANSFVENATKKIALAFETIKAVFVKIEELEEQHFKSELERDVVYAIMLNQNATLHTIIQSSTLIQWKKEEIGKIYADNMKLLATMKEHQLTETTQEKEEAKQIYENCKKQIEENCEKLFKISEPIVASEDGEDIV